MDEDVKLHAVRFISSTGKWADPEIFNEDDAWAFMQELLDENVKSFRPLSDGQLMSLRNLGAALGMRPGLPLKGYAVALKRAFGDGPMDDEDLLALTRYIYGQVNGGSDFEPKQRPKVSLTPREPGERWGAPMKNVFERERKSSSHPRKSAPRPRMSTPRPKR